MFYFFTKYNKSPLRQPVITCNAAPAVKRPNHLHCSSLFHFSCNGEQPGIPTTLHKHFIAKDQTEWSPGPLGSLSALGSQPLLDDQWSNGSSSQFTLDGTQVDIPWPIWTMVQPWTILLKRLQLHQSQLSVTKAVQRFLSEWLFHRVRRLVRIPFMEQEPQQPYLQLKENLFKSLGIKEKQSKLWDQ